MFYSYFQPTGLNVDILDKRAFRQGYSSRCRGCKTKETQEATQFQMKSHITPRISDGVVMFGTKGAKSAAAGTVGSRHCSVLRLELIKKRMHFYITISSTVALKTD